MTTANPFTNTREFIKESIAHVAEPVINATYLLADELIAATGDPTTAVITAFGAGLILGILLFANIPSPRTLARKAKRDYERAKDTRRTAKDTHDFHAGTGTKIYAPEPTDNETQVYPRTK